MPPPPPSSSSFAAVAAAAAAIALKFHPKHVTNKIKTKHIMKISHINVNIYSKTATSQQNSDF
jgi:Tfp pilus assembly major pilin PilA